MIAWSKRFPRWKYLLGYMRLKAARARFFDRLGLRMGDGMPRIGKIAGDQSQLAALRNRHAGKRIFIIGNGPSLQDLDLSPLQNEITIGTNGIYKAFRDWGFTTDYLLFEDVEQTEIHGPTIKDLEGPLKIAALYNAHGIARPWHDLLFMNARLADEHYWDEMGVQFSPDFPNVVYLGSSIVYIALQFAYHLGASEIYLVGVDMDYGALSEKFPPGKLEITAENYDLVQQAHFNPKYYQIGDVIGVPNTDLQTRAMTVAREFLTAHDTGVFNATRGGALEVFERVRYEDLFD